MMTDRLYHHGALHALQLQSKFSNTYFYYFRYRIKNGVESKNKDRKSKDEVSEDFLGISHGDDVFLIYNNPSSRNDIPYSDDEIIVSQQLINLYQNFSSDSSPVYDLLMIEKVITDKVKCLEIFGSKNYSIAIKDESFGHSTFWDNLKINDD
jgi:carboxylesterase type B